MTMPLSRTAQRLLQTHGVLPTSKPAGGALAQTSHVHNAPSNAIEVVRPKVRLPVVNGNAPSFSLQSILDQYLASVDDSVKASVAFKFRGPRSDGVFHASEVSDEQVCRRYLAYGIYQAPRNPRKVDPRMQRVYDNGHFAHARLESYIIAAVKANGGQAWNEMGYEPDGKKRSGTADIGLVLYGWPYFVEIKSMKKVYYDMLGSDPPPHHKSQLNQYMGLAKVRAGFLLYECKDSQYLREYFLRFDQDEWDRVEGVCDDVLEHVAARTLPDKITDEDGCDGPQCIYHAICKKRGGTRWLPPGGK